MSRNAIESIAFAVASLVVGAICVIFGWNLLPTGETSFQKLGTMVPYYFIWAIILLTAGASVILAVFLISSGLKERR
jgi:hypothetical protein